MQEHLNKLRSIITSDGSQWTLPGLHELSCATQGSPEIRIAIIDGPVDTLHPCFDQASLLHKQSFTGLHGPGDGSLHGTHITSVVLGSCNGTVAVRGIAPRCTGILLPVYKQQPNGTLAGCSQRDLARAINQAQAAGAHIINVSGGELVRRRDADPFLCEAVERCSKHGTLIVAAAGNEGCNCDHIPAVLPSVLAVGAADLDGHPVPFSNWGPSMRMQGVVAPGVLVRGALPGGRVGYQTGTSFATPVVTGVVALLLSLQRHYGLVADPLAVRDAILTGAVPCDPHEVADCRRMLLGHLDIAGACTQLGLPVAGIVATNTQESADQRHEHAFISVFQHDSIPRQKEGTMNNRNDSNTSSAAADVSAATLSETAGPSSCATVPSDAGPASMEPSQATPVALALQPTHLVPSTPAVAQMPSTPPAQSIAGGALPSAASLAQPASSQSVMQPAGIEPSPGLVPAGCNCRAASMLPSNADTPLVPAVQGSTRASVRPSARPEMIAPGFPTPDSQLVFALGQLSYDFGTEARRDYFIQQFDSNVAGIFDPVQMSKYLGEGSTGDGNYQDANALIWTLCVDGIPVYAIDPQEDYAVLIYGRLVKFLMAQELEGVERISVAGEIRGTTRLFNGEVVPTIAPVYRGMFNWSTEQLVKAVMGSSSNDEDEVGLGIKEFLQRVYYELRNLGSSPSERAMNFAATNAFQAHEVYEDACKEKLKLSKIEVERSPICRPESDCWDVKMIFFDPQRIHERARRVYRYTIDVVDMVPVTIGELRVWDMY